MSSEPLSGWRKAIVRYMDRSRGWPVEWYLKLRLDILIAPKGHKLLKVIFAYLPWLYPITSRWFWNHIGGEGYRQKMVNAPAHLSVKDVLSWVLTNRTEFDSLLEVGCGTGDNLVYLKEVFPGKTFVGCDFSPKQIERARINEGIKFDVADAQNLPYKDREFDVVLTVGCLAHIHFNDIKQCARELQRVVGTYLFIFEEDFDFALPSVREVQRRSGWHFYHDYKRLFEKFDLLYCKNNMPKVKVGLHTHLYVRKSGEYRLDFKELNAV